MKKMLVAIFCIVCSCSLRATIPDLEAAIEEKVSRLEIESGIKPPPQESYFYLFGDFLYWKASLDGVAWATTAKVVDAASGGTTFDGYKTRTLHFSYDPGFEVGIGIKLPYDYWDVSVRWLRMWTQGEDVSHGSLESASGNRVILDDIGLLLELLTPPSQAKADCSLHLDLLDAVLARTFLWSEYFAFRPFIGARGVWLKLVWDLSFTRPIYSNFASAQTYTFADIDNSYSAGGLVGGFDSQWNFYKELGFFTHASASLIYGRSMEKTKQEYFAVPAMSSTVLEQILTAHNSTHAVKGIFDIALGLKWKTKIYRNWRLLIHAGYNFFYWPAATQKTVTQSTRVRDRADLSFQGMILGGKLEF